MSGKYTLADGSEFGWDGLKGRSYSSKEDFENVSAALFEVTGSHGKVKTTHSDRVYLILEGEGEFELDGNTISVNQTDVVIVPKDTPYDYKAINGSTLKMFLIHTPSFDPDKEVSL